MPVPKNWISFSTPPLLTQHYKVWQSIHSLFSQKVTKVKRMSERTSVVNGEAYIVTFNSGWRGVWIRLAVNKGAGGGVIWASVPYAAHPPLFLSPTPSLRRPCLRGRRGSSTIANGSAAEWWRGDDEANHYAYKSNDGRYLKCVKTALCMPVTVCAWTRYLELYFFFLHSVFARTCKKENPLIPGYWYLPSTHETFSVWPICSKINPFQKILWVLYP